MKRLLAGIGALLALATLASPATAQEQDEPTGRLRLTSQTALLRPGGTFDLHFDIERVRRADELELAVTVHGRLTSRSAFAQTLENRVSGTTRRVPPIPLPEVPQDFAGDRWVSIPFPTIRTGVYAVSVVLRPRGGGDTVDRFTTHLVAVAEDPDITPLSVAWVQPIGAPPGELDGAERASIRTAIASVARTDIPLTLDLTPETLDWLDAAELLPLQRALTADRQLLASPYVDVYPGALLAAGRAEDLAAQRQLGEEALFAAVGSRGDPRTWSAQHLTEAAVGRLRALGVTRIVLPETSLAPLDTSATGGLSLARPFRLAAGGDTYVSAAAVDTSLVAHFEDQDDPVLAAHRLLADLAVLYLDLPGTERGVVVRPPESWAADADFLRVAFDTLATSPVLRPVTLDELFDGIEPLEVDGEPVVREPTGGRQETLPVARLAEAARAEAQARALTPPGRGPADEMRRRLLVAESRRLEPDARAALLDSIVRDLAELRHGLRIPEGRSFRLTAREGTIPLTVSNDNPFPVNVRLLVSSDKLEFPSRSAIDLVLEPGTNSMTIPVRALASGSFTMRTTLLAPTGEELLRRDMRINSSAFSGVGIVLSIGAGLFLLLWWGRHWRTVRRDRRLVDVAH